MTEQEVQKLLQKIAKEKMFGEPEMALAYLNQLHQEFPKEKKYLGLLASSYYELWEFDTAKEYIKEAFELDPEYWQMYELLGMMAYLEKDKEQAESYYFKALAIKPDCIYIRLRLMQMYYEDEKYEQIIEQGDYIFTTTIPDRLNYTKEKRKKLDNEVFLSTVYFFYYQSLIQLNRYKEAITILEDFKKFMTPVTTDPYYFDRVDDLFFKLYYLEGNKKKIEYYKDRWLNLYNMPISFIKGLEQDAKQGYIIQDNPDNYQIDEEGNYY